MANSSENHNEYATDNSSNPIEEPNLISPRQEAEEPPMMVEEKQPRQEFINEDVDTRDPVDKRKREDVEEEEANGDGEKGDGLHPMWKTSLCSYFRRESGSCSHGDMCRYAHGEAELRPRPDNTWDPTSERAKKLLKLESGEKVEALDAKEEVLVTDAFGDSSDSYLRKCVTNLPRKWHSDNLRKFLNEQARQFYDSALRFEFSICFVTFETAEQVEKAIEELNGKPMGNKHLKVGDVLPRSFEKKAQSLPSVVQSAAQSVEAVLADEDPNVCLPVDGDVAFGDNLTSSAVVSKTRSARDSVTPLAHLPYNEQLEQKKKSLEQILKKLTRNARKACPDAVPFPEWVHKSKAIGGLPCKFEGIVESPVVDGYRNKCEFSIGFSTRGMTTVGFMLGNFREGVTAVEEPIDCPNVSKIACKYAVIFQEFLQRSSLPVWNRLNNTGYWRQLTVREGRNPHQTVDAKDPEGNILEVMLIIQVRSVSFDDKVTRSELQQMAEAFAHGASASSPPLPLTSLVVQDHRGISNAAPADAPLYPMPIPKAQSGLAPQGENNCEEARIHDYICNLQFSISPTAFFQVNTLAAEKLYSLAGDWAGLGPDTLLFDICCGTGTIGLTLAHRVGMVVGVEMNASAVSDAQRNAEINGIKNCRFVCAKAEDVIGSLLKEYLSLTKNEEEALHVSQSIKTFDVDNQENGTSSTRLDLENSDIESVKNVSGSPNTMDDLGGPDPKNCTSKVDNGKVDGPSTSFKNVVAIVDPPRVGLHPIVIKVLRTHSVLRRLVYISCNPDSLVANAIELCTPSAVKAEKGNKNNRAWRNMSSAGLARHRAKSMPSSEAFQPVKAMAVDLFPHTPHCEMVMLLER
ncbi:hypothetical protein Syun_000992 [Stephania yunnanensis]|uniref:Zinc finger CCCH domain-containing protein 24 n=1 Tax=Stephania yunnanensis TaxID=152371 RepID=A0AAP0LCW0_9MAGN